MASINYTNISNFHACRIPQINRVAVLAAAHGSWRQQTSRGGRRGWGLLLLTRGLAFERWWSVAWFSAGYRMRKLQFLPTDSVVFVVLSPGNHHHNHPHHNSTPVKGGELFQIISTINNRHDEMPRKHLRGKCSRCPWVGILLLLVIITL